VVAFAVSKVDVSTNISLSANELYAPIFERAILEMWNNKWGGNYTLNNTVIELLVDFDNASIELARLEGKGFDVLGEFGQAYGITNRNDVLSYLWPGYNESSIRYRPINSFAHIVQCFTWKSDSTWRWYCLCWSLGILRLPIRKYFGD
jgi:hypothetical protein